MNEFSWESGEPRNLLGTTELKRSILLVGEQVISSDRRPRCQPHLDKLCFGCSPRKPASDELFSGRDWRCWGGIRFTMHASDTSIAMNSPFQTLRQAAQAQGQNTSSLLASSQLWPPCLVAS